MASTTAWCCTFTPRSTDVDAVRRQHHAHDIFAEIVDVVLHGAQDDGAQGLLHRVLQALAERSVGLLEDLGGIDEFRKKILVGLESLADDLHALLEFFDDFEGGLVRSEGLPHQPLHGGFVQVAQGLCQCGRDAQSVPSLMVRRPREPQVGRWVGVSLRLRLSYPDWYPAIRAIGLES